MSQNSIIVVRGGGDLASGVIHRLFRCGYKILILEGKKPSAIRREVSFCEAVYDGADIRFLYWRVKSPARSGGRFLFAKLFMTVKHS